MTRSVGLIGFGEAGSLLARGMVASGAGPVCAYDVLLADPATAESVRTRAQDAGADLVGSPAELLERSDVLLSVVVAGSALEAAGQAAPTLGPEHLYVDLNSVAPETKRSIGRVVSDSGARYAEGAIMAAVPKHGHTVPILLAGPGASAAAERLAPFGMTMEVLGDDVGAAAATKMFRSVIIKGIESVLYESLSGARAYGVEKRVLESVSASMDNFDWSAWADYTMGRLAAHADRRGQEMLEAANALEAAGVDPLISKAAAERLAAVAELGRLDVEDGGYGAVFEAISRAADERDTNDE